MKTKDARNICDNLAGIAAIFFCFTEAAFPWSLATALIGFTFFTWSGIAWRILLFPNDAELKHGTGCYLITLASSWITASAPLAIIFFIPGRAPTGLLALASLYAFARTIIFHSLNHPDS